MIGSAIACPRVCSLFLLLASCAASDGPIIGVLTVPNDRECETALEDGPEGGSSCFASLYVKYIEAAGGRVAPILYDASDDDIAQIFTSVNGLFFTGGVVNIRHAQESAAASQYLHAASLLFNMTVATNDAGVHMPLWGTCMGFQTLSILAAGDASVLETYAFEAEDLSLPLELTSAARESRLLGKDSVPPKVLRWLTMENLTSNLHHDGVAPESFAANQHLAAFFSVLSTNRDRRGRPFASTIEGRRHPVFAVQWHPERSIFEWDSDEGGINHSAHAVEAMQFFANFFISEARKNQHRFPSAAEERAALIYNYLPQGRTSYQAYVFPSSQQVLSLPARARSPATVVAVRPMRPPLEQQVTWLYAHSLAAASRFLAEVVELEMVLDQGPCHIYQAAPEHFLGVCNTRPPAANTPPVTYTFVVSSRDRVDQWHEFLASKGNASVVVATPSHSTAFNVYAFFFYDPDSASSLGYYRFEVQTFEGSWPKPSCPPVVGPRASARLPGDAMV